MKFIGQFGDVRHGWRGLRAVWWEEWHFKYQIFTAIVAFGLAVLVGGDRYQIVLLFCALCIALASEVINTAIEDIGNKISPDFDERIGIIKDMAQAFVILASLPALVIFAWIVLPRLS